MRAPHPPRSLRSRGTLSPLRGEREKHQGGRVIGIFDIFTGDPGKEAAERSRALLRQTQDEITGRTNATRDEAARYLTGGYGAAADAGRAHHRAPASRADQFDMAADDQPLLAKR